MNTASTVKKIIAGAVLSTGLVVSGFGLTAAIAQAQPGPFP